MEEKLYKHLGQSSPLNLIIALILGLILATGVSFIYNWLIISIPFIYINFLITIGFGASLGYCAKFLSRLTQIRNSKHNIVLAGVIGFWGFYFQWFVYLVYLISNEYSIEAYQANMDILYKPVIFLDLIIQINRKGAWELFGLVFKDFPLWITWGFELILIIGIPLIIIIKHPIVPYSERLNRWYKKYTLKFEFERISTQNQFKENLMLNAEQTITNLSYGNPHRYSEISIYYLQDEQCQYLSVDNVLIENRGSGKTEKDSVVHLFQIENSVAKALMDKYGIKKQFVLDY